MVLQVCLVDHTYIVRKKSWHFAEKMGIICNQSYMTNV